MVLLLLCGVPVAFSLGAAGVIGVFFGFHGNFQIVGQVIWNTLDSWTLCVIVFYVLMGELLMESGLSEQLFDGIGRWVGQVRGSILYSNILASTIFAAMSGSSMAAAASLGGIAFAEGNKRGYSVKLSLGSMAGGATLGILIPPSIIMIVYGVICEQSIGELFMAGLVPGILLSFLFMCYITFYCRRHPEETPRDETRYTWQQRLNGIGLVLPMFSVILIVLGSIYLGLATPNEAGAIGALLALVLGFAYRRLSWRRVLDALVRTAKITSATVVFLIVGASLIAAVLSHSGLTLSIGEWIKSSGITWTQLFPLICLIYLALGCFFDSFSCMVLTLPVVFPIVKALGVNPILFGVIVTILIEAGLITPPFGINLFVLDGVAGGGHVEEIVRGAIPYLLLLIAGVILVMFFPELALWLPRSMR